MSVITISRQLGSGGDEVAGLLCDELGYCRVDKAMLMHIAEDAGVNIETVLAAERDLTRKPRFVSSAMTSLYRKQPAAFETQAAMGEQTYVQVLRETMERYAREGNAVIVGRGGQMILRDWPTALHVLLYAPLEIRVQRLIARDGITEEQAKQRISRSDERKRHYLRYMHQNASWLSLQYYHLAINTGAIDPVDAAQIIMRATRRSEGSD